MTLSTRWSGFAKVAERGRRKCGVFGFFLSLLLLLCLSPRSFFLLHSPVSNLPVRFFFFQVRAVFAVASGFHLRFVVLQKKKKKKKEVEFFFSPRQLLSFIKTLHRSQRKRARRDRRVGSSFFFSSHTAQTRTRSSLALRAPCLAPTARRLLLAQVAPR